MNNPAIIVTSELVTIDHGKYIVKTFVKSNNEVISTALASGYTLEEAENNARKRAIAFLEEINNILVSPTPVTEKITLSEEKPEAETKITPEKKVESSSITSIQEKQTEKLTPEKPKPIVSPIREVKPIDKPINNYPQIEETKPVNSYPLVEENKLIDKIEENYPLEKIKSVEEKKEETIIPPKDLPLITSENDDSILPLEIPEIRDNGKMEDITPESDSDSTLPLSLEFDETMDFSQIIDQTTVEMKRLGWTQDDGKKYLLATYGKKSRHLLSDPELIEFLNYLKTQ